MATPLLGLALPVNGATSWGDTVNNSVTSLLDSAVAGTTTLSTDADVTLSSTIEASNQAREAVILWTASGSTTRYITAPAQSKTYVVINSSSTQAIVLRGVGPTTGVTINAGERIVAAWNGSDFAVVSGYLNIPQNSQSSNYTTVLGDSGKHIYHPTTDANSRTYTIDGSLSYAIGTVIMFVNMTSQSISIALSSGTMYLANVGSTGSRTLGQYGVANALKLTSNTWIITGTVLT